MQRDRVSYCVLRRPPPRAKHAREASRSLRLMGARAQVTHAQLALISVRIALPLAIAMCFCASFVLFSAQVPMNSAACDHDMQLEARAYPFARRGRERNSLTQAHRARELLAANHKPRE